MLFHIVNPDGKDDAEKDELFAKYIDHIKNAYWPEGEYENRKAKLPAWPRRPSEDEMIEQINKSLEDIAKEIYEQKKGLYALMSRNDKNFVEYMMLPFIDHFHKMFLKRHYNCPVRDPIEKIDDFIRLSKVDGGNYSKNVGNYNHFVNVVMATARLIMHFKNNENIKLLFEKPTKEEIPDKRTVSEALVYQIEPTSRTFKLMLAAFYHDIGKTVVDHRHGMEGSFIIADQTTQSLFSLNNIAQKYNLDYKWKKDDLLFIADLLYYHDFFGTLGTGESSYILLADILDKIKRYSLRYIDRPDETVRQSRRDLFDLWILNMADIMVSLSDKWNLQDKWLKSSSALNEIESFFNSDDGRRHVHDLRVSLRLLEEHNKATHTDDTLALERLGQDQSKNHAVERIRRLVCASLRPALSGYYLKPTADDKMKALIRYIAEFPGKPSNSQGFGLCDIIIPQGFMNTVIYRCIQSLSDPREFCNRFAWIACMDYSLGFFKKIADRAIVNVETELKGGRRTGWICYGTPANDAYLDETNAMFFIDNYSSVVVKILGYLLFGERSIDRLSNIEFEDTRERLTKEKIDKIMAIEGPYRESRSVEMILKTVFVY